MKSARFVNSLVLARPLQNEIAYLTGPGGRFRAGPSGRRALPGLPQRQPFLNQVGHDKDSLILPLALPISEDTEERTVAVQRDDKAHRVEVKMTSIRRKVRGDND